MPQHVFISDLHLSATTAQISENFIRFLQNLPQDTRALYILGDLFDAWIGDDDPAAYIEPIRRALKQASRRFPIYFQHGNRDFLLGETFAQASGMVLLPQEAVIEIAQQPILLMHGDQLCSDDIDYQKARKIMRDPRFIEDFLAKPISERMQLAAGYRQLSGESTAMKGAEIMDVNQHTVAAKMDEYGAKQLIHGHTHRPGRHSFALKQAAGERLVLSDWDTDKAEILTLNADDGKVTTHRW